MPESEVNNPWAALSGGSSYLTPGAESQVAAPSIPGVGPGVNGYPQFSSGQSTGSTQSGYAGTNPVDSTPSLIAMQGRQGADPLTPNTPPGAPANMNPWNIRQSSQSGPFDYALGQTTPPPKISTP